MMYASSGNYNRRVCNDDNFHKFCVCLYNENAKQKDKGFGK